MFPLYRVVVLSRWVIFPLYRVGRLARVESEQLLAEQRARDLEILLEKERTDKEAISASYRHELRTTQDVSVIRVLLHVLSDRVTACYG